MTRFRAAVDAALDALVVPGFSRVGLAIRTALLPEFTDGSYPCLEGKTVIITRPGIGAITLALLFGLFNLIYGAWQFVLGIDLRQTGKTLRAVRADKHPHQTAA